MKQPSYDVAALHYPHAVVLQSQEFEGSANLLLRTADGLDKVWEWYARRLGAGVAPSALGRRDLEAGRMLIGTRRTARVFDRESPFTPDEQPQVIVIQHGAHTVTVVLSPAAADGTTRIMLFVLVAE